MLLTKLPLNVLMKLKLLHLSIRRLEDVLTVHEYRGIIARLSK